MKQILHIIISLFVFGGVYAQKAQIEKADKKYEVFQFIEASKIYQKVAESGYESEELFKKLGDLYYFKSKYTEAEKWYEKLYKLNDKSLEDDYLLRYAQTLKVSGKKKKAAHLYNKFLKASGVLNNDFTSSEDYLKIIAENSNRYNTEPIPINLEGIDYGTFVYKEKIYFSSSRNLGKKKNIDAWSDRPFLDIYEVDYNKEKNSYGEPKLLKGEVNTKLHECSPVITKDGKTLYFTRNNTTPRIKEIKNKAVQLKIYRATKVNGKWDNIEDLSINGDNYSNAHPTLSPDEKVLYFVSNMSTSIGQTDLYAVEINNDGSLGKPRNLGAKINTKGRESFPFVTKDNELYFSSDGHFGLGGYDVFYIDLKKTGGQLLNVGEPINGAYDDYAFSINNHTKKGFFSSSRSKTDNIYSLKEIKPIKELLEAPFTGQIVDSETGKPISDAKITIESEDNILKFDVSTDENGFFETKLNKFKSHVATIKNKDYETTDVFLVKGKNVYEKDFKLVRNVFEIAKDSTTDLSKILKVKHIYFDFAKAVIKEEAKIELEKIVAAMEEYPDLKIDIRSHTDTRATEAHNMVLSIKRANATMEYLVKRGIDKSRLSVKGYGETQPLNLCNPCSEEEHAQNRRSEFIILQE
ncbi:WD40-like Beta Propeller Repeat [Tenacibaculum sediminilitoris]|uniref:OmpA family protein n=1 Tax=Tenacibaculum sediminilitoris TaxID=1820334 RepID=UPI0038963630